MNKDYRTHSMVVFWQSYAVVPPALAREIKLKEKINHTFNKKIPFNQKINQEYE